MTNVPQEKYAPLVTLHGQRVGLDESELVRAGGVPAAQQGEYLLGRFLKGVRVGQDAGGDYKLSSPYQHNDFFADFLGPIVDASKIQVEKGTDGAAATAQVAGINGILRLTSGAGAAGTPAVNGAQVDSFLNWSPSSKGLRVEFRVGNLSSLAGLGLFIGLTNQAGTLQMPFQNNANVITAAANDAVGFLFDTAATTQGFWQAGVKGGVLANNVPLTEAQAAAPGAAGVFNTYRLEFDPLGNATFYICPTGQRPVMVGQKLLNAVTPGVLLTPVVHLFSRTAASKTADVDYILAQQIRQ